MAVQEGLTSILVEGGSGLASAFLAQRCVNRIDWFVAGRVLGSGLPAVRLTDPSLPLDGSIHLEDMSVRLLGRDVLVSGLPKWE
jgi:diaminohydroxyphosphoribosylaminopyrimidine deaminase/5-amino-6-(5-phosphoribosylamino)uracil reductase